MESVGQKFPKEQARVRELLAEYRKLGAVGAFGAIQIEATLQRADQAAISADPVAILRAYEELRACQ